MEGEGERIIEETNKIREGREGGGIGEEGGKCGD